MMKKRWLPLVLISILLVTACSPSVKKQLDKADDLVREKEYKDAAKIYEAILDKDKTEYEAWDGLVKAYIKKKKYKDADEALEAYFKVVKKEYGEDEEVDYDDLLEDIHDYARDILEDNEEVGSWYEALSPPMIDLKEISLEHNIKEPLKLDVPKDVEVYYTLDGSKANKRDQRYKKKGIQFEETGAVILTVVGINEFGIKGGQARVEIMVYDGDVTDGDTTEEDENNEGKIEGDIFQVTVEPGTYNQPIILDFFGYDTETMDLYYTMDDSDVENYGTYYLPEEGIELLKGDYKVHVILYDYDTDSYTEEKILEYTIDYVNPNAMAEEIVFTIGLYDVKNVYMSPVMEPILDRLMTLDPMIQIKFKEVDSLENLMLALESGEIDAYYGPAQHVTQLAKAELLRPVKDLIVNEYRYYAQAEKAGLYKDNLYTMPISIQSELQLHYDYYDVLTDGLTTWAEVIESINATTNTYDFLLSEETIGQFIYGLYLNFGGTYEMGSDGQFVLDEAAIKLALEGAQTMVTSVSGEMILSEEAYEQTIGEGTATMVLANTQDMNELDAFVNYLAVGPMPMPMGGYLKSVNTVQGLHLNSQIEQDANKLVVARLIYKELATGEGVNAISSSIEMLPAIDGEVNTEMLWLYGDMGNYKRGIENGLTVPITNQLRDVYANMAYYYKEVATGVRTPEVAAKYIIQGVIDYK